MAKTEFLTVMEMEDKEMLKRLSIDADHSMAWVIRRLIRNAHAKCYEVNTDGDALAKMGLR